MPPNHTKRNSHNESTILSHNIFVLSVNQIDTTIRDLYVKSRKVVSLTPIQKSQKNDKQTESSINKCAQIVADNDNYKSAIDRLTNNTPIAINTPEIVEILKNSTQINTSLKITTISQYQKELSDLPKKLI